MYIYIYCAYWYKFLCIYTHHIYIYAYFISVSCRKTTATPQLIFSSNSKPNLEKYKNKINASHFKSK